MKESLLFFIKKKRGYKMSYEKYKYYFYYLKDKYVKLFNRDQSLYAYTDDKNIAKMFESTRDMNLFKKEKESISKKEVNVLALRYKNEYLMSQKLFYHNSKFINMAITLNENSTINEIGMIYQREIYLRTDIDPFMFSTKERNLLKDLNYLYFYMYQIMNVNKVTIIPNLLQIFVKEFGKTLKGVNH